MARKRARQRAPRAYWVGIVDGVPYCERTTDTYGPCARVELFASRAAARARFEAVARVEIRRSADAEAR